MVENGFTWETYLQWVVETTGALSEAADRLAATRGYEDDVATVERALRRLRARGTGPGGKWGARAIRLFGLPDAVAARVRWMGAYHSRFTDLPVGVCEDLIRAWDRPPTTDARPARTWLQLARVTLALRRHDVPGAATALAEVRVGDDTSPEARVEWALAEGYVASRRARTEVARWLAVAGEGLAAVVDPVERACLHARWIDHLAYDLNHRRPPDPAGAERLYLEIPEEGPPFALARRANGLAYCRWQLGRVDEAVACARAAADHAGDGGHVRLRAMALGMLARIDPSQTQALERARAIAQRLDDEILRFRYHRLGPAT